MAKKTINGVNVGLVGASTTNYIKQISDGKINHDLALTKGISFFNGSDGDAIVWDGTQSIEVVIPSVTDIIQDPVRMVGTVGADGNLPSGLTPVKGDLVYMTADCTFQKQACEAGDMAIYDGEVWHVIQGENQVSLVGTPDGNVVTTALSGDAKNVLTVEGKNLALKIDYNDVNSHLSVSKNDAVSRPVENASVEVSAKHIGLVQASATDVTVGVEKSIDLPTALASGKVTIDNVLASKDFTFTSGSFPTISKNNEVIVSASHNMKVVASGAGSFVTDVDAIKGITFSAGDSNNQDFGFVASLAENSGASFVNGVHAYTVADESKVADFTIWGEVTATTSKFVSGLSETEASGGDVVTNVIVGNITLVDGGEDVLTGLSKKGSSVVTSVSVGTLGSDSAKQWFFSGLSDGSDVVSDVVFDTYSLDADATGGASAIVSASVSDHVLSFGISKFQTPVKLSKTAGNVSRKGFAKAGVTLTGTNIVTDTFKTASLSQTTEVHYGNFSTDNVTLSQTSTKYFFDKAASTSYSAVMGYVKASVTPATMTKNGAVLSDTAITATIPANTFAVGLTGGSLPSLTIAAPTGEISGTVDTSLTTTKVSWLAVTSEASGISIPGAVSLSVVASDKEGAVSVASEGTYTLSNGATVTIPANSFLTGASILVDKK